METNRPFEGQEPKPIGSERVPSGQDNLVPSMETKREDPQQTKSRRRRKRTSKHVNIIETPTKMSEQESTWETVEEALRPLEMTPQMVPNSILELTEENWVKSSWEEVCKANKTKENKGKDPIAKVDLDKKQAHVDMVAKYTDTQSSSSSKSKASNMKELPSFINLEGSDKEVLKLPS